MKRKGGIRGSVGSVTSSGVLLKSSSEELLHRGAKGTREETMKSSKYRWMSKEWMMKRKKKENQRPCKKRMMKMRLGISDTIISSAITIVNSITSSSWK
jgi:hypothetical protein